MGLEGRTGILHLGEKNRIRARGYNELTTK